jgi:hypothetical protein
MKKRNLHLFFKKSPDDGGSIVRPGPFGIGAGILDGYSDFTFSLDESDKFLNRFSVDDIKEIFRKSGLDGYLHRMGFRETIIKFRRDEYHTHHLSIYHDEEAPQNQLINLRLSESKFLPNRDLLADGGVTAFDVFVIEWLSLENTKACFSAEKPQLPGQRKPGLGALGYFIEIMHIAAKTVSKDAFLDVPDHVHCAVMYSRRFRFFNPLHEAFLRALLRDLGSYPLADITWGFITKTILDAKSGEPQEYRFSEQLFPVSDRMKAHFNSRKYRETFNNALHEMSFRFDYERMSALREKVLGHTSIEDL